MTHSLRRIAIWIDQREAIVAVFSGDRLRKEEEIFSDIDQETHHKKWTRNHIQAHKHEHLKHFYEEVVQHFGPADEILILGPGQAKHELHHHVEHHKGLKGKVTAVENVGKMSETELVAHATTFFKLDQHVFQK
ncbi:MAG: hypothetical protein H6662_01800 [Ardenticatenaceae bacterium]|nr:hypothetical protein [Anaerolineales bacterium]MCB8920292.1 hypothetical protein [Ardenticatenaceae bacterium]